MYLFSSVFRQNQETNEWRQNGYQIHNKRRIFNNFINYTMSNQACRPPQILTGSIIDESSYSYLNLPKRNNINQSQRFYLAGPSGILGRSRSRGGSGFPKKIIYSGRSHSASSKKWKNTSRSKSKTTARLRTRLSEKPLPSFKKQYKVPGSKPSDNKMKNKKSCKILLAKKTSMQSLFKKLQTPTHKKKKNEEKQKKMKTQKSKDMRKTRTMKKCQSQSAMDRIALSEIHKVKKSGVRDQRVIHQYFGHDDHLASILELKEDKFRRSKTKIDKQKTRSSASSTSQRKLSKFGKPTKAK